ncbi:MAG: Tfp pilus assembly protein PilE [Planctomycetota bacterium]|jgi:Tfp pilus assembly protein PilE
MNSRQRFTLIERLVIIAIIGILARIVLSALGKSRDRARDACVISCMRKMHSVTEPGRGTDDGIMPANLCDHEDLYWDKTEPLANF